MTSSYTCTAPDEFKLICWSSEKILLRLCSCSLYNAQKFRWTEAIARRGKNWVRRRGKNVVRCRGAYDVKQIVAKCERFQTTWSSYHTTKFVVHQRTTQTRHYTAKIVVDCCYVLSLFDYGTVMGPTAAAAAGGGDDDDVAVERTLMRMSGALARDRRCSRWRAAAAVGWTARRWAEPSVRAVSAGRSMPASPPTLAPGHQMASLSHLQCVTTVRHC